MVVHFDRSETRQHCQVTAVHITEDDFFFQYASKELQEDKRVAVAQNGCALRHVSHEWKEDKGVVLVVETQNGWPLQYASKELIKLILKLL